MNTWLRAVVLVGVLGLPATNISAQEKMTVLGARFQAVTGEPYSADSETTTSQTLADGTHINRTFGPSRIYRDSAGRERVESYVDVTTAEGRVRTLASVTITDPVARVSYLLNVQRRTARQLWPKTNETDETSAGGPTTRASVAAQTAEPPPVSKTVRENIGTEMMQGLSVIGTRNTTTTPVGAEGNDRPIEVVAERWYSSELQITVLFKRMDPRSGETITSLTNIDRSEPEPSLFQLPADYTVVQQ